MTWLIPILGERFPTGLLAILAIAAAVRGQIGLALLVVAVGASLAYLTEAILAYGARSGRTTVTPLRLFCIAAMWLGVGYGCYDLLLR